MGTHTHPKTRFSKRMGRDAVGSADGRANAYVEMRSIGEFTGRKRRLRRMGKDTSISWCQHTFSPRHGCVEVSPACDPCYARELDKRFQKEPHWGKDAPRRF